MRVAVIHDWLDLMAGSESVLKEILLLYPDAEVFSVVNFLSEEDKASLHPARFHTSFIQRLPFARKHFRGYLPLMPLAVEQFDLSGFDLIISSSHAVSKGVITGPDQLHISYVHSPIRYAWDLQPVYLKEAGLNKGIKTILARLMLHYIRLWDRQTSNGVNFFMANSHYIARRIQKIYRREAEVVYPPVAVHVFTPHEKKEDFYLTASRFAPYKKIPMIIEAFKNMPDKKLIVIGSGPTESALRASASSNVVFLGYQKRDVLVDYMQRAKAFVFASEEDFGIVPVEAQACGTPVIAFGKGGARETVIDGKTGLFFYPQTTSALQEAVERFEKEGVSGTYLDIRRNAERFDVSVFREKFKAIVDQQVKDFHA